MTAQNGLHTAAPRIGPAPAAGGHRPIDGIDAGPRDWEPSWLHYTEAADEFRRSGRRELGIPGEFLPHGEWKPAVAPCPRCRGGPRKQNAAAP